MDRRQVTGLVLAGGQGLRMGGVNKGLQRLKHQTLIEHVIERLASQVGSLVISANQNLAFYQGLGWPVYQDAAPQAHEGPLAGLLSALTQATTPYLLMVPCDTPYLPLDLHTRLAQAFQTQAIDLAVAKTAQIQPLFCLLKTELQSSLRRFLQSGQRQAWRWIHEQRHGEVFFADDAPFFNINTPGDLIAARP